MSQDSKNHFDTAGSKDIGISHKIGGVSHNWNIGNDNNKIIIIKIGNDSCPSA